MLEAVEHTEQIEKLWATHIGDDKSRMMLLSSRPTTSEPEFERHSHSITAQ
jgi:hypothetical protein